MTVKKTIIISLIICIAVAAAAFFAGALFQKNEEEKQKASLLEVHRIQSENFENYIKQPWVKTVPGTTVEMLSPDFWKNGLSGELLFSEAEIKEFQKNNPLFVEYYDREAGRKIKLKMYNLPEEIKGTVIETLIDPDYIDRRAEGTESVFINGKTTENNYWESIRKNCAFERIPETVVPQYCVCVKRDLAMIVPTDDFASENADEIYCNDFISAEVMPLTGLVSLHESRDGKWLFVINGSYCGWVKKESLAFCTDKNQWLDIIKPEDFLTVTACEITLDETALPSETAGLVLPMGTKIKLIRNYEGQVFGRTPYDCYVTEIPFRKQNGGVGLETVLIPISKGVTPGILQMTSEAVINQAFSFLGKVYGWGGSFSSNDCSGIIRQVFACFGFELPRNSAAIAGNFDLGGRDCNHMTVEKKLELLKKIPSGSLLAMDGHLMIYLGTVDNKPYVISSCSSCFAPDDSGKKLEPYGVFVSDLELVREDGKTWLESLNYFQWKDY